MAPWVFAYACVLLASPAWSQWTQLSSIDPGDLMEHSAVAIGSSIYLYGGLRETDFSLVGSASLGVVNLLGGMA